MKTPKYARNFNRITRLSYTVIEQDASGNDTSITIPAETKNYGSTNNAKRESRHIQMREDGALGRGSLIAHG